MSRITYSPKMARLLARDAIVAKCIVQPAHRPDGAAVAWQAITVFLAVFVFLLCI